MSLREQMDDIYGSTPLQRIPWHIEQPPELLQQLVEQGQVRPCTAVDLGCGAGNYALWLAAQGFAVTGIDLSAKAIEIATEQATSRRIDCTFLAGDLTEKAFKLNEKFAFAYDWEVLHHVFPEQRELYLSQVRELLEADGLYFSVCFSEQDPDFGGVGKYRQTPMDTTLYFSSEQEIQDLLEPGFAILQLSTQQISGKYGPHMAVVVLARRRD